jgi:HEAT repeat protein
VLSSLPSVLGFTAAATVALTVILVVTKLVHREIQRWQGVRSAHYLAAIGEMLSRRMVPQNIPRSWATDPIFWDALAEYRLLVTGADREHVDRLATQAGVHRALVDRSRRRFPSGRRLRAVARLADLATPLQRQHLRSLLDDGSPQIRTHAVRGLARLKDIDSIPRILDLARRVEPWEAARIADSLIPMGMPASQAVCAWVEEEMRRPDCSEETVALAVRILGSIGDPEAEPTLLELLKSPNPEWRVTAASALERTGGPNAIEPLLEAIDDHAWQVRARAAISLGAIGGPGVARALAGLLYDPVWWVRQNAASALADLPGGTDHLIAALDGPDPYAADSALNQLTISGVLAQAAERVRSGVASERDRRLAAVAAST